MRRREFIVAAVASAARPLAAWAQQPDKQRSIGVLMPQDPKDMLGQVRAAAFVHALSDLGWGEGENLNIEWRWAGGEPALFERYSAELVALNPDVLVPGGTAAVEAMRRHTNTLPIVFAVVTDPVGQGFVSNLARPGGNITSFTDFDLPMASKWLAILSRVVPAVSRVAVLYNPATAPFAGLMVKAIQEAAPSFSMAVYPAPCHGDAEIEGLINKIAREEGGGVLVLPDAFTVAHRTAIIASVANTRIPAIYWNRLFAMDGGLMSYGTDIPDVYQRAAAYVDRILRGARVVDLPVQMPTKFELVISLKTAKALDLNIASSLLATADEVIE
jgi:putative tryptophan/tyrosine transport system substrate-binding protein